MDSGTGCHASQYSRNPLNRQACLSALAQRRLIPPQVILCLRVFTRGLRGARVFDFRKSKARAAQKSRHDSITGVLMTCPVCRHGGFSNLQPDLAAWHCQRKIRLAGADWKVIIRDMRTGELHRSGEPYRKFYITNYADLSVGRERKKTQEPDRYVAELRAIRRQQRFLLVLVFVIACIVIGSAWILSRHPASDSPEIPSGVSFPH